MSTLSKPFFSFFWSRLKQFYSTSLCHSLVLQQLYAARTIRPFSLRRLPVITGIFLSAIYFTSCEKVISIDLNETQKKYVIEAQVTDQDSTCTVRLSQTKNFADDNSFTGISGAQITITDNNGTENTLAETNPGFYQLNTFTGISGHTYKLAVNINGEVFTATSTMPALVPLDSVYITERTIFDETNKYASVQYTDPLGNGNAYRFIQYVNGVKEKTIFVRDDDLSDGRTIKRELIAFEDDDDEEDKNLKAGDNVRIEMLCLEYPIYTYWYSLAESSTGENQSASPANPVSNIQGGALGYFSAHTIQSKTLIVQ